MTNKKSKVNTRILIPIIALIAILIVVLLFFKLSHTAKTSLEPKNKNDPNTVNYSPPTANEKTAGNNAKDRLLQDQAPSSAPSGIRDIIPTISRPADNAEITVNSDQSVSAYISGIIEEGGTCTLRASQGELSFSRTASGFADATTTICNPFSLKTSDFSSKGNWAIQVSYLSKSAQGTSKAITVSVK